MGPDNRRRESIDDYYANRSKTNSGEAGSYRPLKPDALYLAEEEWTQAVDDRPIHLTSPFPEPESAPPPGPTSSDDGCAAIGGPPWLVIAAITYGCRRRRLAARRFGGSRPGLGRAGGGGTSLRCCGNGEQSEHGQCRP